MVAVLARGQFIKSFVFDLPTVVADGHHRLGPRPPGRERGHPDPLRLHRCVLSRQLPANRACLETAHHAHRPLDLRPTREAFDVPQGELAFASTDLHRRGLFEKASSILQQVAAVVFQHGQGVLALVQDVVEEPAVGVQRVPDDHVEGAGIAFQHPSQQTDRRGDLVFSRPDRLGVQQQLMVAPQQLKRHVAVVILRAVPRSRVNHSLQTSVAPTLVGRVGLMPVQHRDHQPVGRGPQRLTLFASRIDLVDHPPNLRHARHSTDTPYRIG